MWTSSECLCILLKVKNHPLGENSANLVTLAPFDDDARDFSKRP
jgi:hypothetical protein